MFGKERPRRVQSALRPATEALETRQVLTAGAGSTFALIPQTIAKANDVSTVEVKIDPTLFKGGKGNGFLLGVDVAPQQNSAIVPKIQTITVSQVNDAGRVMKTTRPGLSRVAGSTAVLVPMNLGKGAAQRTYLVRATVAGQAGTSGNLLLGYYLPGDANGDGVVNRTDIAAIRSTINQNVSSSKYSFDHDVNRDGKIDKSDISTARKYLGMSTTQSPVVTANLDGAAVVNGVRATNAPSVNLTGVATPGASVTYTEVNAKVPTKTVTVDTTGKYAIDVPLALGPNTFQVTTQDPFGQSISGQIAPITRNA